MSVLFISENHLKEHSIINDNVDNKYITPVIVECQDFYIHPILGTGLFKQIKEQITSGELSVANKSLLDSYIIPCLIAYIRYEACLSLNYKLTNKNVSTKNSENSQALNMSEIITLMDNYKNKAEVYAQRLINFLKENKSSYPLYSNPGTGCDVIKPIKSGFTHGWYLE